MNLEQDLLRIARQEQELVFDRFDELTAWQLGVCLRDAAGKRNAPLAIDVFVGGCSLFTCMLPGTSPNNVNWVRRKRNSVLHFHRSSYGLGLQMERDGTDLGAKFGLSICDYAVHGGSFPIRLSRAGVIGAVTVSGLPQREDHKFVVAGLAAILGKPEQDLQIE